MFVVGLCLICNVRDEIYFIEKCGEFKKNIKIFQFNIYLYVNYFYKIKEIFGNEFYYKYINRN